MVGLEGGVLGTDVHVLVLVEGGKDVEVAAVYEMIEMIKI